MITMTTGNPGDGMTMTTPLAVLQDKFNPIRERTDLHNGHVIDWKWHLQETRGFHWALIRHVSWIDPWGGFA